MIVRIRRIYLRLSSLAAALAEETTEETEPALVSKGRVGVSKGQVLEPTKPMREGLFVEMTGHVGNAKTRSFPGRITHHCVEMPVARVPPAMIGL